MRWPWGFKPVAMTAIDILLDPGHMMLDVAKVYNATMHQSYPKEMMAKKINQFTFKSESVSIYQLGELGTAQKKLWTTYADK